MNNIRLFFKESLSNNLTGKLNKDQSHYLLKVMRIKKGDNFNLFNENDNIINKKIVHVGNMSGPFSGFGIHRQITFCYSYR